MTGIDGKKNREDDKKNEGYGMWCSLLMATNHSEEECRLLKRQYHENQVVNFAQWSGYPPVTDTREQPPATSSNALEAPKMKDPPEA